MNTLHQNTFYFLGTLCIVNFCSKEHFASNWLNTVYSSAHFASWNVQLLGTLCSPTPFAPQNPLLLNTFCCQEHFTSQHILLPGTLCSSAPFPPGNILLLNTFYSLDLFAPWNSFDHDVKYVKQNSTFNFVVKNIFLYQVCFGEQMGFGRKVF